MYIMKIFYPDKIIFKVKSRTMTSTLLIPEQYVTLFNRKKSRFYGTGMYLHYLLKKYGSNEHICKTGMSIRNRYQKNGQDLVRYNFRPFDEDWLNIKIISQSRSISITYLFIMMMLEESSGNDGVVSGVVPTDTSKLILIQEYNRSDTIYFLKKIKIQA